MNDQEKPIPENPQQATEGVTRREFCLKGAAVVGAVAVTLYVPPRLTPVALPAAFAKAAPANKESCEKDPVADKDPGEKDPGEKDPGEKNEDKDPGEKDPGEKVMEKDPATDKDPFEKPTDGTGIETTYQSPQPMPFTGEVKDEWC